MNNKLFGSSRNFAPAAVFLSLLSACGGDSTGPPPPPPPPPASLQVSPASVSLGHEIEGSSTTANLTVMNGGGVTMAWNGTADQPWIGLSPASGSVAGGQSQTVTVSVADVLLAPGTYAGTITVTANASNSPASVAAALNVDQAAAVPLALGTPLQGISGNLNSQLLFSFQVLASAVAEGSTGASLATNTLTVRTDEAPGGSGSIQLLVRQGSPPTTADFDCESALPGNQQECEIDSPVPGTWFALIVGAADYSGVSIRADRANQVTFTLAGTGAGTGTVTSIPAGISCTSTAGVTSGICTADFDTNSSLALTATPASGSSFAVWMGDCTGTAGCNLTMDADKNATAQFDVQPIIQNTLTVAGTGTGNGTVTSDPAGISCTSTAGVTSGSCSADFDANTAVSLTATPASGSSFAVWTGDCTGSGGCNLTMDADKNATAQFVFPAVQNTLTIVGFGSGNGTVTSSPSGINCTISAGATSGSCVAPFDGGSPITLTAAPAGGFRFQGWASASGLPATCIGPNPVCVVTLTENNATFASFQPPPSETFDIDIRFNPGTNPTQAQMDAFAAAEARWEGLMNNGIIDFAVNMAAGDCGSASPALNETIDDLVILVTLEPIDGVGSILGQAGPCNINAFDFLPRVGLMRFDTADLMGLEIGGNLNAVILHEMGHVLGIGVLWDLLGLLGDPSPLGDPKDTFFSGPLAIAAFDMVGGTTHVGNKVPVENMFSTGTINSHWRESVFDDELMTGFVERAGFPNPLSKVTVESLNDTGYDADPSKADSYFLPLPAIVSGVRKKIQLLNDIYGGPIYVTGPKARTLGEFRLEK